MRRDGELGGVDGWMDGVRVGEVVRERERESENEGWLFHWENRGHFIAVPPSQR